MTVAQVDMLVNQQPVSVKVDLHTTLAEVLRDHLHLKGTKIGCEAGDCGACTVLMDNQQVCSCLVPIGQCHNVALTTVEACASNPIMNLMQSKFLQHGAAQCGICTPGMLLSALELLQQNKQPLQSEIEAAIGGTLCRCTGYVKIVEAILDTASELRSVAESDAHASATNSVAENPAVGCSVQRVDGLAKVTGTELFAADVAPEDAYWLRVVRSEFANARFTLSSFDALYARYPGLRKVLLAEDVPGHNGFGIYPDIKDQPVLADGRVLFRGQAILALIGERATVESIDWSELGINWTEKNVIASPAAALASDAEQLHSNRPDNVLITGRMRKGDPTVLEQNGLISAEGHYETSFVEHAYIEPEAGYAQRDGDRITVYATTQAPVMDLEEVANVLGIEQGAVRIIPSACGGGFGGKLDVSVQPLLAVAAWVLDHPVRMVMNRIESMISSTKRHPASIKVKACASADGKLQAFALTGDFDTGAYASWGPTVAGRVPLHCTGPYALDNVSCTTRAIHTNAPPSGAFRGFGTPQAAIARELTYDQLADKLGMDRWEFRRLNAFRSGDITPSGQQLNDSVGMLDCLQALKQDWLAMLSEAEEFNSNSSNGKVNPLKRGVGIACMWYGCGNTGLSNPSTMRVVLKGNGRLVFYNGAVDIGQGSNTVLLQICADAVGLPMERFDYVSGDTDLTEDAGKTSASRQTFVSGKAAMLAGLDLRTKLLRLLGANADAELSLDDRQLSAKLEFSALEYSLENASESAVIAEGCGVFDPPITPVDANGQGRAYATYAFAAQICSVDVDVRLGTVQTRRIVAAHDVGKAVNPQLIEGQIHGGIMQGLGMALMEEYLPGKTENLHDYLIPTAGDVPEIDIKLVEAPEPLGPYGAKGVGEPALVPTPAAILGAIRHATGVTVTKVPVLPHRLYSALQSQQLITGGIQDE